MEPPRRVRVIVNPAAGQHAPILALLNEAFGARSVDWDAVVTQPGKHRQAVVRALRDDPELLLIYGGDGTVARTFWELLKLGVRPPVGVLPGGTANALAEYLQTDLPIADALERFATGQYVVIPSDVGRTGEHVFLSRVSVGVAAGMTGNVTREEKERLGLASYALSSLRATREAEVQPYRLTLDGRVVEVDAVGCIVANGPGTGLGIGLGSELRADDAVLDVFVIESLGTAAEVLANAVAGNGLMDGLTHYRARTLRLHTPEPVRVHADGEHVGSTPVEVNVVAGAARLVSFHAAAADAA